MRVVREGETTVYSIPTYGTRRMIRGIASTPRLDSFGTRLLSEGCIVDRLPIPVLYDHTLTMDEHRQAFAHQMGDKMLDHYKLAEVVRVEVCPQSVRVDVELLDDEGGDALWEIVKAGANSFSVTFAPREQAEIDGVPCFTRWRLNEVSVMQAGANPDAKFQIVRTK